MQHLWIPVTLMITSVIIVLIVVKRKKQKSPKEVDFNKLSPKLQKSIYNGIFKPNPHCKILDADGREIETKFDNDPPGQSDSPMN